VSGQARTLLRAVWRWPLLFLAYGLLTVAAGAIVGTVGFLLLGKLFTPDLSFAELARHGLRMGSIYAGVWAPGLAIVLCFMHGKRERDRERRRASS
jgi:hypothetical protein